MFKRTLLLGAACGCAIFNASTATADTSEEQRCLRRAAAVLTALDAAEYEQARSDFDERMRAALAAAQLQGIWEALPKQVGARISVGAARIQTAGAVPTVVLPLQHEKAWLDLQISCDAEGKIAGMFVRPGQPPANPAQAAAVAAAADWSERDLAVASAGMQLPGTLTLPKSGPAFAGIVLVHGSGSNDRDESIGPNKVFADLAHGLAALGVASLRYDKRSYAQPTSFAGQAFTVQEEVVDDAVAALKLLGRQPELGAAPVFVLGHSLGAMLAPRIAAAQPVAGMILMAAPARSLTDIIPQQIRYIADLDGARSAEETASIEQVQTLVTRIKQLTDKDRTDTNPILGAPPAYWLDLRDYDPIRQAIAVGKPTLLLQGQRDYQVTMADDYEVWVQGMQGVDQFSTRTFAGLSHLFMPASDPPGPADYQNAGHVDAKVIGAIADWIKQHQ
jgi:uncharacterized protein